MIKKIGECLREVVWRLQFNALILLIVYFFEFSSDALENYKTRWRKILKRNVNYGGGTSLQKNMKNFSIDLNFQHFFETKFSA